MLDLVALTGANVSLPCLLSLVLYSTRGRFLWHSGGNTIGGVVSAHMTLRTMSCGSPFPLYKHLINLHVSACSTHRPADSRAKSFALSSRPGHGAVVSV